MFQFRSYSVSAHSYLETGGEGAVVRPWFWISWLFCGPMLVSVLMNRYYFYMVRVFQDVRVTIRDSDRF